MSTVECFQFQRLKQLKQQWVIVWQQQRFQRVVRIERGQFRLVEQQRVIWFQQSQFQRLKQQQWQQFVRFSFVGFVFQRYRRMRNLWLLSRRNSAHLEFDNKSL